MGSCYQGHPRQNRQTRFTQSFRHRRTRGSRRVRNWSNPSCHPPAFSHHPSSKSGVPRLSVWTLYQLGSQRRHIAKRLSLQLGRSFCPVERTDVLASHVFHFRTSLSDELCLFAILSPRLSVFRVPSGRFQIWELVFVLS